jgi:hypothetical protein
MEFTVNRSQSISTDILRPQQSTSSYQLPEPLLQTQVSLNSFCQPSESSLSHNNRTQASSNTFHQQSESLPHHNGQSSINYSDSNIHNILNTKEFRMQHLNSLRITYGISDHETIRIMIDDRSSITDYLLNWIYSAEVKDLIKEPLIEITSEK